MFDMGELALLHEAVTEKRRNALRKALQRYSPLYALKDEDYQVFGELQRKLETLVTETAAGRSRPGTSGADCSG